jgi:hypothetical protein
VGFDAPYRQPASEKFSGWPLNGKITKTKWLEQAPRYGDCGTFNHVAQRRTWK